MSTSVERFWTRVDKTPGCWNWTATFSNGYGVFPTVKGSRVQAHRFSYELLVGPIPDGLVIDHLCRNTRCVNPDHLEPVTIGQNVLRGVGPAVVNAAKTHCSKGHPFDAENTWFDELRSQRHCRTCFRIRKAARLAAVVGEFGCSSSACPRSFSSERAMRIHVTKIHRRAVA